MPLAWHFAQTTQNWWCPLHSGDSDGESSIRHHRDGNGPQLSAQQAGEEPGEARPRDGMLRVWSFGPKYKLERYACQQNGVEANAHERHSYL
jgi:hypothetical protein